MNSNENQEIIIEQLSKKAKQNIERNDTVRRQDSIFIKMLPDEEIELEFNPEQIELKEINFAGIKSRKLQYTVVDSVSRRIKYWSVNHKTSALIDSYLLKGYRLLKIKRMGLGLQTKYQISIP